MREKGGLMFMEQETFLARKNVGEMAAEER